jgi:hypothetical protein
LVGIDSELYDADSFDLLLTKHWACHQYLPIGCRYLEFANGGEIMKNIRILPAGLLILILLAACSPVGFAVHTQGEVTEEIQPTITLQPTTEPPPSETPQPTSTFTPEPTSTPEPTATSTPNWAATVAAEEAATKEAQEAEIRAELEELNLDPERGRLAWTNEGPIVIRLDTYNTEGNEQIGDGAEFSDFVLKADLTWESTGGLAICGFWLRGESYDQRAAHYLFQTIRLSGLPEWDVEYWKYKDWVSTVSPGGQVQTSVHINQDQGATNTYLFVADGPLLTIYANGNRLGRMTLSTLNEGVLGSYIWQESGETTCTWDNVWIWDLSAE